MPPVPKRKTSKGRRDRRRSHLALTLPSLVICPKCKEPTLPYHACPNCGAYRGRQVFTPKDKERKSKK
ncbi:MAG: 50S ribosomal protein L32 [Thermoflexales bacterium]|nr:50S ribosomal protein L32 [Thermoflexales bacterium]